MWCLTVTVVQVQHSCFPPSWRVFHMSNVTYVLTGDAVIYSFSYKNKYVLIKPVNTQQVVLNNTLAVWNVAAYLKHTLKKEKCRFLNVLLSHKYAFVLKSFTFCRGGFGCRGRAGRLVIRSVVWSPAASDCYRSSLCWTWSVSWCSRWMLDRNTQSRQTLSDICITHVMKQTLSCYIWTIM